jgi:hypothetical protein
MSILARNFTLSDALLLLKEISFFLIGISAYSIFVFHFYKFIARREIFQFNIGSTAGAGKFFRFILYVLKHIFILPLIIFFWFLVFAVILAFLSKQDLMQTILLISISLVGVIRTMSYYDEDLSKDLAKMLPFALLGVFLVDISYFSLSHSFATMMQLPGLWQLMLYYLMFIITLEFVLRIGNSIVRAFKREDK